MKAEFTKKSSDPSQEYFTKLRDINITTVDSFQVGRILKYLNYPKTNKNHVKKYNGNQ